MRPPLPRRKVRSKVLVGLVVVLVVVVVWSVLVISLRGRFLDVGVLEEVEAVMVVVAAVVVVVVVVDDVCGKGGRGAGLTPPVVFHHIV